MMTMNEKKALTAKELEATAWHIMNDRASETAEAFKANGVTLGVALVLANIFLWVPGFLGFCVFAVSCMTFVMNAVEPLWFLGATMVAARNHAVIADLRETLEGRE